MRRGKIQWGQILCSFLLGVLTCSNFHWLQSLYEAQRVNIEYGTLQTVARDSDKLQRELQLVRRGSDFCVGIPVGQGRQWIWVLLNPSEKNGLRLLGQEPPGYTLSESELDRIVSFCPTCKDKQIYRELSRHVTP